MSEQGSDCTPLSNALLTLAQRLRRGALRHASHCASTLSGIAAATLLAACSSYTFPSGTPSTYSSNAVQASQSASRPLVGMAISGGGNRSALFAAYVLELFGSLPVVAPLGTATPGRPISFLDSVGYLSSVSSGSFAASYFSMHGIGDYSEMLTGKTVPVRYEQFFTEFKQRMNFNWKLALFENKLFTFSSNAHGWTEAIDKQLVQGATFADLDKREASGASPYLILNATHYDTGRRFVMTTIPNRAFCLNTEQLALNVIYTPAEQEQRIDNTQTAKLDQCDHHDALTPEGFDNFWNPEEQSIQSAQVPLSHAVAASGAFPLIIGPIAYRLTGNHELLHLVDGGVTDNSGVESIQQLFLRDLLKNHAHRDLIVSLDASLPFNAYGTTIADDRWPLSMFADDPTRLSDIQEERASTYRRDLWNVTTYAARTLKRADGAVTRLNVVNLKPDDLNVSSLQIDTPDCHIHYDSAQAVYTAARDIPTAYHLAGCDLQLVRIAACWSVHQHARQIQQFFDPALADRRRGGDSAVADASGVLASRIQDMCPELVAAHAF
ncbi:patatin-like phospholipase family protein [Paraburkholderia edwinii]|uniref:Patatin-like phospholipase family protein n=1 Tax=Paraburkholderia edwinii TaxID=2861782 RepID=A0ABX8UVU6_9BURK|nr:patatin-like phospholipase family protein [Paraburkholderia edwinii]QYD73001.1 patatin-like phospholipase family protein [Paraburkholderia edwinii]